MNTIPMRVYEATISLPPCRSTGVVFGQTELG